MALGSVLFRTSLVTLEVLRVLRSRLGSVRLGRCMSHTLCPNYYPAVAVFAAVDQGLSDRVAKAIGAPTVKPLKVKPAAEALRFKPNASANRN
jgi:hypothetical protein